MRAITIFSVLLLIVPSATATEVRLRSAVVCASTIVRLADVAEIHSAETELSAALGTIAICVAPPAGGQRTLSQHDIRQLLTLSDVEIRRITITGSEEVVLQSDSDSPPAPRPVIAAPAVRQALYAVGHGTSEAPSQPRLLKTSPEESSRSASPLPAHLVDRGASITVHSNRPGIRISTSGKALQPGSQGETIAVELTDSRERIQARVVGPKVVEIVNAAPAKP